MSTRLFIQAAVTALLAPLTKGGPTWLVLSLAVAAGAVGVAMLLRSQPANAKVAVIGFEAVAVAVGALGIAGGHYIPGTIIGIATLIAALNMPAGAAQPTEDPWVPPADGAAPDGPFAEAPAMSGPSADSPAPVMDNPYAPPAAMTPAPMMAAAPVMAQPAPMVPAQPMPVEATMPDTVVESADEAPVAEALAAPAPEVTQPMRPEDIPPAPRALTILPGR